MNYGKLVKQMQICNQDDHMAIWLEGSKKEKRKGVSRDIIETNHVFGDRRNVTSIE